MLSLRTSVVCCLLSVVHQLTMRRYDIYFCLSDLLQTTANNCKQLLFITLKMSVIKYFSVFCAAAPASRSRVASLPMQSSPAPHTAAPPKNNNSLNSLPTRKERRLRRREVYLPKGVRNVSEAFRDTRIMRVRHARRRLS